jgi:hypothetical protein
MKVKNQLAKKVIVKNSVEYIIITDKFKLSKGHNMQWELKFSTSDK